MATENALIGLWAETSMHAGAGSSVDGVDLPIQREGHSNWPCVFGSSVKGALRCKAEDKLGKDNASISYVFGPDSSSETASEHAGALLVSDARLLLLPVRSLTSKAPACSEALSLLLSGPNIEAILASFSPILSSALARNAPLTDEPKIQGQPLWLSRCMGKSTPSTELPAPA